MTIAKRERKITHYYNSKESYNGQRKNGTKERSRAMTMRDDDDVDGNKTSTKKPYQN